MADNRYLSAKKIWIAIGVIIIVLFVGWRWYGGQGSHGNAIEVGVASAQTGDGAEWGQGELNAVKMYIDDVNAHGGVDGTPIRLSIEDTRSTGVGTVNAITKLISIEQVPAIIGPTWADSFQGGNPIAENAKTVLISPSAALETVPNKEKFTYLFSTWWPQAPEIKELRNFMLAQRVKTFAIINDHDSFDTKFADDFEASAVEGGMKMVDREQVPIDQTDFRTEIVKIKDLHPDALFIEIENVSEIGPFMKQAKELGLSSRIFGSPSVQNADALSKFGDVMEGLTYVFARTPTSTAYDNFVKGYEAKYGELPSGPSDLNAYNAVAALVAALRTGARTGTQIRDALHEIEFPSITGSKNSFDNIGQIKNADFEMKMVHGGKFITIPS